MEQIVRKVSVPISADDDAVLKDMAEESPFPEAILVKLALRIGIQAIKKDPSVLMPFVAKQNPPA